MKRPPPRSGRRNLRPVWHPTVRTAHVFFIARSVHPTTPDPTVLFYSDMFDAIRKCIARTKVLDWAIALALVVTIIAVAMYVCNRPDAVDSEAFFPSHVAHESFANARDVGAGKGGGHEGHGHEGHGHEGHGNAATVLSSADQLDSDDSDVACCLVYYDRCGHCQTFKPVWKRVCQRANDRTIRGKRIRLYETGNDTNEAVWKSVSERHGIQGYPTILVKIGGPGAQWKEYNGPRDQLAEHLMTQQ